MYRAWPVIAYVLAITGGCFFIAHMEIVGCALAGAAAICLVIAWRLSR